MTNHPATTEVVDSDLRTLPTVPGRSRTGPVAAVLYDGGAWLALIAFVVAALGTSLMGHTSFFATDIIESMDPWRSVDPAPSEILNGWLGDTIDTVGPSNALVASAVRHGDLPQWNPYVVGGAPLLPIPDNGHASPLTTPWYLVPDSYAPGLVKLLEIITVTVGMSLLGRRWGLRSGSWALAALVFCSSGYLVAWTNWSQTRVVAFVPLLFWAVDRIAPRTRVRDLVAVALVTGAMITGGYPAVAGWALYFAAGFLVVRLIALRPSFRQALARLAIAFAGVAAGVTLLAWQLLPFVRTTLAVIDLGARRQSGGNLPWWMLLDAVAPALFGGPSGASFHTPLNPVETLSYLGAAAVAVLLLGALLRVPTSRTVGVGAAVYLGLVVSVFLVYVGGPVLEGVQQLPVFSTTAISRMRMVVSLFAALAVMLGFDAIVRRALGTRSAPASGGAAWTGWGLGLAAVLATTAVFGLGVLKVLSRVPDDLQAWARGEVKTVLLIALTTGVVVLIGVALGGRRGPAVLVGLVVPALIVVPAVQLVQEWWPQGPVEFFYATTPTHEFLEDHLGHERFATVGWAMLPGSSSAFELRSATGHSFHSPAWKDMLEAADDAVMLTPTYSTLTTANLATSIRSPILDRLAVRYVVMGPESDLAGRWEDFTPFAGNVTVTADGVAGEVTGPFRAVRLRLPEGLAVPDSGAEVEVVVVVDEQEVSRSTTAVERGLFPGVLTVSVAAEGVGEQDRARVEIGFRGFDAAPVITLNRAAGPVDAVQRVPLDDQTVVSVGGATVVERESALPRIRWADSEVVVTGAPERLALLASGDLADDVVVLSEEPTSVAQGADAEVAVIEDIYDRIRVEVEADGAGWLVVADNLSGVDGWAATVDGQPVQIEDADHVGGAVAVPEGLHEVELVFTAPGAGVGAAISAGTAAVLVVVVVAGVFMDRRRRVTEL